MSESLAGVFVEDLPIQEKVMSPGSHDIEAKFDSTTMMWTTF
jgi:hypothetical protein